MPVLNDWLNTRHESAQTEYIYDKPRATKNEDIISVY